MYKNDRCFQGSSQFTSAWSNFIVYKYHKLTWAWASPMDTNSILTNASTWHTPRLSPTCLFPQSTLKKRRPRTRMIYSCDSCFLLYILIGDALVHMWCVVLKSYGTRWVKNIRCNLCYSFVFIYRSCTL